MSKTNKQRREQKKRQREQRESAERRGEIARRRVDAARKVEILNLKVPNVSAASETELMDLVPRTVVEALLGRPVEWLVLREKDELLRRDTSGYNMLATADIHNRLHTFPPELNPLRTHFDSADFDRRYSEKIGYRHNQFLLLGVLDGETVVSLHVGGVYPSDLFINDIELANPNGARRKDGLFIDQKHPGLGGGVFDEILKNLRLFGARHGFTHVSCHAVDQERAAIFMRREFVLDDRDLALLAGSKLTGKQVPLRLRLTPRA